MRLAYFDCFSGASGDMIVGALLDAGLDMDALRAALAGLKLPGCTISAEQVRRAGLAATKFNVQLTAPQPPRRLSGILQLIDAANLPARAAERAKAIFLRLGQAEAKVHALPLEEVHFHEVGAADSIIDVVGAAAGMELLGIEEVHCSPLPVGSGVIKTEHGLLPVPAPATAELLKGAALAAWEAPEPAGELTTPTGAAVLTALARDYGGPPAMELAGVGYGAGAREHPTVPNLLRVLIGSAAEPGWVDTVVELSANLDDCTGEVLGATMEKLLQAACLDAWCAPIYMKKSRPAWTLSALCLPRDADAVERMIFAETTTLGVRRRTCRRSKLARRHVTVETAYGPIRVKVGLAGTERTELTATPEFADCAAAGAAHGVPLKEVMAAAMTAFRQAGKT
jgi:hypothetical protein